MKKILLISTLIALILVPGVSLAAENIPGFAKDKGKKIVLEEPLGWDIEVNTTYNVKAIVESLPGMSIVRVKPYKPWYKFFLGMPEEITISIDGFEPNTDLYVYTNGYREETIVTTDENGTFEITKPTDESVQMIIKNSPSTYHISVDPWFGPPGEDCQEIGVWNVSTNTCTLTGNVNETISIEENGITLDGAGFSVTGGTGDGIFTDEKDVVIKNVTVTGFARGVVFDDSFINFAANGIAQNVTSNANTQGMVIEGVSGTVAGGLTLNGNLTGIQIIDQLDGNLTDGIVVRESRISSNGTGLFTTTDVVAEFVQNNFISNTTDTNISGTVSFDNATDRGNYWSKNTECTQDAANPDECTNSYLEDDAPWACENAWSTGSPCPTDPSGPTEFPSFTQINAPWSSDIYDSSDEYLLKCASRSAYNLTIGQCGCLITSIVNVLHSYGISNEDGGVEITPKVLDDWLASHNGYTPAGSMFWSKIDEYVKKETSQSVSFLGGKNVNDDGTGLADVFAHMNFILDQSMPAIVRNADQSHFFVVYEEEGDRYKVRDPSWYNTEYLDQDDPSDPLVRNYDNTVSLAYSYKNNNSDTSLNSIEIIGDSPIEILITDPLGRRLGVDPNTGIRYEEIPGGLYWRQGILSIELIGSEEVDESAYLWIPDPIDGDYSVQVVGTGDGEYILGMSSYNSFDDSFSESFADEITETEAHGYTLSYDESGGTLLVRSGDDQSNEVTKVLVCHIPSGNPENAREINIGESAVPAHINHGDVEGSCDSSEAQEAIADKIEEQNLAKPPKIR